MSDVLEIFASLSESFIIVRLCRNFLGFRDSRLAWLKSAAFFIFASAFNILFSQRDGFEAISPAVFTLMVFGYVLLLYKGKIFEKILITIVPIGTILPINLIVMNLFRVLTGCPITEITQPSGKMRIPVLVFSKLAFFFVCEFLTAMRKRSRYSLNSFQWMIQLSCFMTTFFISFLLWNISVDNDDISQYFMASIAIGVLNILLYAVMDKMQRDNAVREDYEVSLVNLAAQERFVNEARERYMEMRTLRHDMRHCLTTAAELIAEGKSADAKQYIERVLDEKVNQSVCAIDTGSVVIDAVISNHAALCLRKNIGLKCMIDMRLHNIDEMDASILLSNVLDNAVNGCTGTDHPQIELIIGTRKLFTYIIVKNSIRDSVLSGNPDLATDKPDKSSHGFGVMSIRKIADKYNGSVEFREEDHKFITEIWLEEN